MLSRTTIQQHDVTQPAFFGISHLFMINGGTVAEKYQYHEIFFTENSFSRRFFFIPKIPLRNFHDIAQSISPNISCPLHIRKPDAEGTYFRIYYRMIRATVSGSGSMV
jgi:hypothetical protein